MNWLTIKNVSISIVFISVLAITACDSDSVNGASDVEGSGAVVDTGQTQCYDNENPISPPGVGEPFYGQDGQFDGVSFSFRDNGNGTVTDLNTGLVWQQIPAMTKYDFYSAGTYANSQTSNAGSS